MQLLQVIENDDDNEAAYVMLAEIAGKQKNYPEQVYYYFMALDGADCQKPVRYVGWKAAGAEVSYP